ncbi:hypothetical protein AgCh_001192 [Apium graveolens]
MFHSPPPCSTLLRHVQLYSICRNSTLIHSIRLSRCSIRFFRIIGDLFDLIEDLVVMVGTKKSLSITRKKMRKPLTLPLLRPAVTPSKKVMLVLTTQDSKTSC